MKSFLSIMLFANNGCEAAVSSIGICDRAKRYGPHDITKRFGKQAEF